jgi:hypothetical protein
MRGNQRLLKRRQNSSKGIEQCRKRVKPEIGMRAVRTKQVACEVLSLWIYGLTHFRAPEDYEMLTDEELARWTEVL